MENWCWHEQSIALISRHFEHGDVLPPALLESLVRGKHFQSAMQMMRQLEFALFDMWVHMEDAGQLDVLEVLDRVRQKFSVKLPPEYARFSHTFTHIFAGGYAAGYYSYKWAEVLAADVFSRFLEDGIFNVDTGRALREEIFAVGGSREPLEMFQAFRGRAPEVDALLRLSGIGAAQS
jgi:oligopeptidase A